MTIIDAQLDEMEKDLKKFYHDMAYSYHEIASQLLTELHQAREVLKFYADKETYAYDGYDGIDNIINNDSGARAREALGYSEEKK